jgi:hypothetical protein
MSVRPASLSWSILKTIFPEEIKETNRKANWKSAREASFL